MRIKINKYEIKSKCNAKIVLISDVHYSNKKEINHLNKVLNKIYNLKPDFICIPGDLTDLSIINDEDYLLKWLKKLANISKVIISLGNHEFYIDKKEKEFGLNKKLYNKIKKIKNLFLLDNTNIKIGNINFMGLTLPIEHYMEYREHEESFYKYLYKLNSIKDSYNVLLCHSPINISLEKNIKNKNIDLILCGHMHGGVTPMFLRKILRGRGFIYPNKKLFPKYCYGLKKIKNTYVITTSGITVISSINKFRMFKDLFPSEIVYIKLKK